MASWFRSLTQSPGDVDEDDFFPALLAETHPLPPAMPAVPRIAGRLPAGVRRTFDSFDSAQKERAA